VASPAVAGGETTREVREREVREREVREREKLERS
jgi:hypothetical protein